MNDKEKLEIYFYKSPVGAEPFAKWLKTLDKDDLKIVAQDIKTVQLGYPLGMPLTRVLKGHKPLEEIRCKLKSNKIARILFYVEDSTLILLHGFIKKSQKPPLKELETAFKRYRILNNQ